MGLALSLVSLLATGQVGSITLNINSQTEVSISASSCSSTLTAGYSVTWSGSVCSALKLWVTRASECADAPTTGTDLIFTDVAQSTLLATTTRPYTNTVSIPIASLPYFTNTTADGGASCGSTGIAITHKFCASLSVATDITCAFGKNVAKPVTPVSILYDTQAPAAPSLSEPEPFEGAASVTVTANDSDTASIAVQARVQGVGDFGTVTTVTKPGSVAIPNLTNGTTYELRAIAYDAVTPTPNASEPSGIVTVTPRESAGFWDACRAAGCGTGGCNAMAAGPLGLAALALAVLVRRMRR